VLESYLDDLLDLGVSDESLFIRRSGSAWTPGLVVVVGGALLYLSNSPLMPQLPVSVLMGSMFLAGILTMATLVPRTRTLRRLGCAKVLSSEVARRRGRGKHDDDSLSTPLLIRELWRGDQRGKRLPAQPARASLRQQLH
jgi:hypothetical protein